MNSKKIVLKNKWIKKCIIFVFLIFIIVPTMILLLFNYRNEKQLFRIYNIMELYNYIQQEIYEDNVEIQIGGNNNISYDNKIEIGVKIKNRKENEEYEINIINNGTVIKNELIENEEYKESISLSENKNDIDVKIYIKQNIEKEESKTIYFIPNYNKQFLDEISKKGIQVHYRDGSKEEYSESNVLLKNLGVNYVRADFLEDSIERTKGKYNFSEYDKWVNDLKNNSNIKILAIINGLTKYYGNDMLINNDKEIENYIIFLKEVKKHYQQINDFQILNEVNVYSPTYKGAYLNEKDMAWYSKLINELQISTKNESINIITAGTATPLTEKEGEITSEKFYKFLNKTGGIQRCNNLGVNPYAINNLINLKSKILKHNELFNSFGGFSKMDITEYGSTVYLVSEKNQAEDLVKQTINMDNYANLLILYNLWTTGDSGNYEQFGILRKDYTPRPAYYSMKNYYQNTNGAEYIGQVNIANGIEAHVYDKDGKPKIIAWATDTNKPVTIDYLGFKASDLYGKEIENTNGKLEITTSPVYIDNVSTKNFYQAISNSITTGYKEFDEKFANEINKVPELKTKISNLNTFAESLKNVNTLDENIANSKMKEHFSLGNTIIKAYDDGRLDIEYVKLSSILDYLNTIGNAYEDLITVSAKTRITDLTSITNEVNEAKSIIENDTDIDIVYPNKIYKFSKDLLDTSSYVLGLDEENDIKTGLINSKATHAKYLADWSEEFSKIYIKGWLQEKVNSIKDENSKVYSKNEQLKSNTKINTKYNSLIENLNNLPSQTTSITKDTINSIYNQQYELINTIVEEFNNKKINISESEYQTLVTELLNILEQYKELFNTYITEDDIQNSTIENNINNVIDRYNENKDIDMTMCAELINNIKEIYNDKIQTEETSYNYLNKRRIQNTCTIISKMLENKIKETAQQEAQKIGIAYNIDQSTLTNKDVIAQIQLPNSKSNIESNLNNEKYTFTENGTKNITINIRGYKYNYNIKVTNIDKTPPQITGIEQGGKYKESITPQITDENLSEVKLIKDGQEVENYKQNTAITQEGIYQLKATDKAGNETSINFVIAYPEDEKYKIENNTIKNIKGETSVEILKGKLQVDEKYTIKRKDTEIQNSENIATGDILETESGNKYTLIVRGDLNKDGKVDIKDLVKMRKFLLLGNNLDESEEMAADTNIDGKEISIKDLVKMRIILLTQT